jgi:hypothetical protein
MSRPLSWALTLLLCGVPSCDPVLTLCVTVVSCKTETKITGARVRIATYRYDDYTGPDGRACYSDVGTLGSAFTIDVDKPGYASKTAGPFQPEHGSQTYDAQVCLEPTSGSTADGGVPESDGGVGDGGAPEDDGAPSM